MGILLKCFKPSDSVALKNEEQMKENLLPMHFMGVPDLGKSLFPEDGIRIEVIFEFKQIMRGIFQEKR